MGFMNGWRPFRPIFHISFWPSLNLTRVRFIGEIPNAAQMQDMNYDVNLIISGQLVLNDTDVPHRGGQRWTRRYWIPQSPSIEINIDHNVPYLIATGVLPNYNTSVGRYPKSSAVQSYQQLLSNPFRNKLLYPAGFNGCFGCYGLATPEQGLPFSSLTLQWILCEGADWRAREKIFEIYERFAIRFHVREGDPRRRFDLTAGNTTDGVGRFINRWNRPQNWVFDDRDQSSDRLNYIPPFLNMSRYSAYRADIFEQFSVDPGSLQYLLSGDYYLLEQ
jgi:hypothetical protein